MMPIQVENSRNFGVNDKPPCSNCGVLTFLARRSPAADHARQYERQIFVCLGCEQEIERIVGADGKPIGQSLALKLAANG
jgi:hypothetical protein